MVVAQMQTQQLQQPSEYPARAIRAEQDQLYMVMEANQPEEEEVLEQPEVMFQQMEQAQKVVMALVMTYLDLL